MKDSKRYREPMPALSEAWSLGDLRKFWPELVGAQASAVTTVQAIDRTGALSVRVHTLEWMLDLTSMGTRERFLLALPKSIDGVTLRSIDFAAPMDAFGDYPADNDGIGEE